MKKHTKKILSVFLAILMIASIIPVGFVPASAEVGGVQQRLEQVKNLFPSGSYFSVNGKACPAGHGSACSNCNYPNVVHQRLGWNWTNCWNSWSCYGFSCFVTRYIFGTEWVKNGASWVVGSAQASNKSACDNLFSKARVGDIVSFGTKHRAIYLGKYNDGIIVYDANQGDRVGKCNLVKYDHYFSYSGMLSYYGQGVTLELRRMSNYDQVNGTTPPPPPAYTTGTYECTANVGVKIRKYANTSSSSTKLGLVPYGATVEVTDINGNWGYVSYNGASGWTCLDYYNKTTVKEATTPTLSVSSSVVARGSNITLSYSSTNAVKYHIYMNGAFRETVTSNTYNVNLANAGTYSFYVVAENSAGKKSSNSSTVTCEAKPDSKVKFVDFDGSVISGQDVKYGGSATAPAAPERKGYSFNGWDTPYTNITQNTTITAKYTKIVYKVNFYGQKLNENTEPELLDTQNVEFESNATPPTETNALPGYNFIGWNSNKYNNVYTDSNDRTINIYGVYEWFNENLPVIISNVIATREKDEDGYRVSFDIQNYNGGTTKGRAIITLKTAEGKLISTTESASFKLGKTATKHFDEFVDCESVATVVEVVITNGLSTGVPISESVTENVDTSEMWSDWSDSPPADTTGLETEQKTLYRSRDKETATNTTKTLDGWIYDGTYSTSYSYGGVYYPISGFSTESQKRTVTQASEFSRYEKKTLYNYSRYANSSSTRFGPCAGTWNNIYCGNRQETGWRDSKLEATKWTDYSAQLGSGFWRYNTSSDPWYNEITTSVDDTNRPVYVTRYDYTDEFYTYNFYRWKAWSDWGEIPIAATDSRQVEQKTQYRWFSTASTLEDNSGESRTISSDAYGKMPECAGKQLTLIVYKYGEASDFTDEFVGQTTVAADGSYSFSFKLREEPSIKTGDYTIALGVEGTTELQVIGTIVAPKPIYTVNFYDANGNIISTQRVTEGENAEVPELPEKNGYRFIYWNLNKMNLENDPALSSPANITNVRSNMDIYPAYEHEEYTVVFVDWLQQTVEARTYKSGEIISAPDVEPIVGYNFDGWDALLNGVTEAESDMVITAEYSKKVFTIKFVDIDGKTIVSEQQVEYKDSAIYPDELVASDATLCGFVNPEEYQYVDHDAIIYPEYLFDETASNPVANYESGEYDSALDLTLTSDDANAVIYYSLDGSDEELEYTGPIHIDRTSSVSFHAESLGKNNSDTLTNYYCINSGDTPTSWMTYAQLPDDVKINVSKYTLESEEGFRYKDTQTTALLSTYNSWLHSGWAALSEQTVYSAWQDGELTPDNSLINCTVETQEVQDTNVYRYQYSHYKYTDSEGTVVYAPGEVSGVDGEWETVIVDSRLSTAGFLEDMTSYYSYNGETWFNQTRIYGVKTQYRLAYTEATVYKWTAWDIVAPASGETREFESETVYRFYNKDYHIVTIWDWDSSSTQFVEDGKTVDLTGYTDLYGFNFDGLYTNPEYTNVMDASTPITESMDLYVNYTPKQYTVTFQMQDGTEISTQTVDYLNSATSPDTDNITGWVFAGWDKPFDSISEDTVITGKYVRESEYARISLNLPKVMMYVGNSTQLDATITPSNLTNEEIFWSSSDLNVVTVDESGKITAVGPGTATVAATAVSSGETARCEVNVSEDYSTRIILASAALIGMDSERNVRVTPSNATTVADIKAQFINEELSVFSVNGTELADTDLVTTGTTIKLMFNNSVLDSVTVVYTGDFDCDGRISNRDVVMISQYVIESRTADRFQLIAIDVNGDGHVNNKDCTMLLRYIAGKEVI